MREADRVYVETPIGPVAIRYQISPFRLIALDLPQSRKQSAPHVVSGNERGELALVCRLIEDYFRRRQILPPWPLLATGHLTPLQQEVLYETAQIPYGSLKTYKWVAEAIGRPRACRFVGTALGKNPFPVIIPCHRVIRNDGRIGSFGAGPEIKQWLIDFESGS